jgi:protocadherin delta 1
VADANDNSPVFDSVRYEATIAEHSPAGTEVVRVHASDADAGLYGMVTYKFVPETEVLYGHLFAINNRTGRVYVRNDALNREEGHTYPLGVMATDDGLGSLPTFAKIVVHVRDVNDNAPQIVVSTLTDSGYAEVAENAPSGTLVAYITVSDADLGPSGELQCSLDNNNFELQQIAGSSGDYKMISAVAFDREIQDTYVVGVTCHDGGQPRMTSAKNVVVRVTDENDNGPQFGQSVYVVSVREGNAVGALLIRLNATDRDTGRNSDIKYNVADNDAVYVDTAGGTVRARIVFDYELQTRFQFVVTAEDKGVKPRSASATIILDILDANDNVPEFHADAYEFAVPENLLPHSPVGTVNASDADSYRHNSIIYTIDPPGMHFDVDQYTGVIVTRSELDRELRDVYHLRLAAYNPELPDVKGYVNVTVNVSDVNDNAPTVVFPQSPNNTAYVSTRAARGFVLTSLVAYDRDSGDNGRLKYVVDKQHSDITASLYDVSPDSGQVTVVGDLTDRDLLVTRLHIIVRDRGLPFRETRADLYVVISEPDYEHDAIMAGDMGAGGRLMSRSNLLVVIAIVCGTTAVILTIVAIMCLTHRRDDRRDRRMQEDTGKRLEDSGDALFTQLPPPGDTQQQMTMMMRSQGEYGGGCTDVYQQQQRHRLLQPLTSVEGNGAITSYSDKQVIALIYAVCFAVLYWKRKVVKNSWLKFDVSRSWRFE